MSRDQQQPAPEVLFNYSSCTRIHLECGRNTAQTTSAAAILPEPVNTDFINSRIIIKCVVPSKRIDTNSVWAGGPAKAERGWRFIDCGCDRELY